MMTEDQIVDAVADAIEATMFAPHELPLCADLHAKYCLTARAAIAAHEAALREAGFQIARPHDWKPEKGWPYDQTARVRCQRCRVCEDDIAVPFSCGTLAADAGSALSRRA
jgi:hypothetical protein